MATQPIRVVPPEAPAYTPFVPPEQSPAELTVRAIILGALAVPRRFGEQALRDLVEQAGLTVRAVHGVRIFADLVPASAADAPAGSGPVANVTDLLALEAAASALPEFRAMATQLHVLAGLDEA